MRRKAVLRNPVYAATAAIVGAVLLASTLMLWQYWTTIVQDAGTRSATLAFLLAEQTTRTFQAVDLTLQGLQSVLETNPPADHAPAFEKLLAERVAELDFIHALFVTDAAGRVTQISGADQDIASDVSNRGYFMSVRDRNLKFRIGHPVSIRPGTISSIPVVRRLMDAQGHFAGIIAANVEPKYFNDFYRNLDLGPHASIDLYQNNGTVLLASSNEAVPQEAALHLDTMPPFEAGADLGQFRSASGEARQQLFAYHRAQNYPLVVAVGIDFADLRSRWWHVTAPTLGALAAAMALGIALAVLIARRLEERRQAQNRALTVQKLEALGQMTASVSHDFRNLLTVMTSTLRLLRKHGPQEKILAAAEEAIERGSGLVTQLLAFSKRRQLEVRPADLNGLLSGLENVLRHAAGASVVLAIDKGTPLPACKADQTQFDAALMNLVVNARQAMPQGGRITIATRLAEARPGTPGRFVEVRVADTGCGIAPADLKRIFEPFFTTKSETGTGLGLAQVYGFMRQIGGDVLVASSLGRGTTFRLLFPIAEAGEGDLREPLPARGAPDSAPVASGSDAAQAMSPR